MYTPSETESFKEKMKKLCKKDRPHFERLTKKMKEILEDPTTYKKLGNILKGVERVHIGSAFVLTFRVDEKTKIVLFIDYDHRNRIYRN